MKKHRAPRQIPVSQRDLASYLGISVSMLNMSSGTKYTSHQLSSPSSTKLMKLMLAHLEIQKSPQPGTSLRKLQDSFNSDAGKAIKKLESDAHYCESRAVILKSRLDKMTRREQEDRQWLNTVDHLLANLPKTKEQTGDRKWLEYQQLLVSERLQKKGRLLQAKLEIQIELEKARAAISKAMIKKLKTG